MSPLATTTFQATWGDLHVFPVGHVPTVADLYHRCEPRPPWAVIAEAELLATQLTNTKDTTMTTKPTPIDLHKAAQTVRKVNVPLADQIDAEAKKQSLPPEPVEWSVVRGEKGAVFDRGPQVKAQRWYATGTTVVFTWDEIVRDYGPLTVIYTPGDPDPRDVVQVPTDEVKDALEYGGAASLIRDALEAHEAKFGGQR